MKQRPLCVVCIGLMIVLWICKAGGVPVFGEPVLTETEIRLFAEGQTVSFTGRVIDRRITSDTVRYTLHPVMVTYGGRQIRFSHLLVTTEYRKNVALPGDSLSGTGELRPVEPAGNPGQFDAAAYYACQKIFYRIWSEEAEWRRPPVSLRRQLFLLREQLTGMYADTMQESSAGILSAMLLGDRAFLTEDSRRSFQAGGCLHLLVISGLHVTLLGMGILQLLLRLRIPQGPACALAAASMFLYTALTGMPVAAVRACIMFLVYVLARALKCSYDSASAMALAAALMLVFRPGYLFHAGFQLSFAAAAGASLAAPILRRSCPSPFRRRTVPGSASGRICGMLWDAVVSWCAIQLCTLPLTARYFYELPVWSLPVNLLLAPCMQQLLRLGAVGSLAALAFPPAARVFLLPADLGLRLADGLLQKVRYLPGSTWICGQPAVWQVMACYAGILSMLYLLYRRGKYGEKIYGKDTGRRRAGKRHVCRPVRLSVRYRRYRCRMLLPVSLGLLFLRNDPAFSLTMLDVGQGDCIVLQTGRQVFLSDGGSTSVRDVGQYRILSYLMCCGIGAVDIFISHDDADHCNGIEELLVLIAERKTSLRVRHVFLPGWMAETESGRRIADESRRAGAAVGWMERGDGLACGELQIRVLHPFRAEKIPEFSDGTDSMDGARSGTEPVGGVQSGNAGSLVLQVTYGAFSALLTGDLEKEGEEELLPYLSDIDCLKAGHHGSRWSTSEEFLEVTKPEIALISAPKKSLYGHPHRETLERLSDAGAKVFATRDSGAVRLCLRGGNITVETWK